MNGVVLRWGRSAYETSEDLALERDGALGLGLAWSNHENTKSRPTSRADVLVVTSQAYVDAEVLDHVQPSLVLTTTSGFEHVDRQACAARGVSVARCPLARRDAVVQNTIANLIRLLRRLPDQEEAALRGEWARGALPGLAPRGLGDCRVVVVGLGVIGLEVARHLRALGASIIVVDPYVSQDEFPQATLRVAIDGADALTLHAAATAENRGMIREAELRLLGPGAVVVNTARGDLLEVDAAVALVREGHLAGLACDVFPSEPWPGLAAAGGRILFTPHASGYTVGLGARVAREVTAALSAWTQGLPVPWSISPVAHP